MPNPRPNMPKVQEQKQRFCSQVNNNQRRRNKEQRKETNPNSPGIKFKQILQTQMIRPPTNSEDEGERAQLFIKLVTVKQETEDEENITNLNLP